MTRSSIVLLGLATFGFIPACAGASDEQDSSAVAAEEDLTANINTGYFVVTRQDNLRKCPSPMCGGLFVKSVNKSVTRCSDGSYQEDCYVGRLDYAALGLSSEEEIALAQDFGEGRALIRGSVVNSKWNGSNVGKLKIVEAWHGASGAIPEGTFYRAADNGIRCVKAPCPSTTAYTLNSHAKDSITAVSLTGTTADAESIALGSAAIGTSVGALVAGGIAYPKCLPSNPCGPVLIASEFYLPVKHVVTVQSCGSRGLGPCPTGLYCQWDISAGCGAWDAPGTCQPKPAACPKNLMPVCGCDGQAYSNACLAAAKGISVVSTGACK